MATEIEYPAAWPKYLISRANSQYHIQALAEGSDFVARNTDSISVKLRQIVSQCLRNDQVIEKNSDRLRDKVSEGARGRKSSR